MKKEDTIFSGCELTRNNTLFAVFFMPHRKQITSVLIHSHSHMSIFL